MFLLNGKKNIFFNPVIDNQFIEMAKGKKKISLKYLYYIQHETYYTHFGGLTSKENNFFFSKYIKKNQIKFVGIVIKNVLKYLHAYNIIIQNQ